MTGISDTAIGFMIACSYLSIGTLGVLVYYRLFHDKDTVHSVDVVFPIFLWPVIGIYLFTLAAGRILARWFEAITGKKLSDNDHSRG